MASDYTLALKNSSLLTPQYVPDNYFAILLILQNLMEIIWNIMGIFQNKYIENGGDGIYAAAKLLHQGLHLKTIR